MWTTAALVALVTFVNISGCRKEQGSSFRCTCSFLTDFDDASKISVRVCAPSLDQTTPYARGCAQSAAPAPVQSCDCSADPSAAGAGCEVARCEIVRD